MKDIAGNILEINDIVVFKNPIQQSYRLTFGKIISMSKTRLTVHHETLESYTRNKFNITVLSNLSVFKVNELDLIVAKLNDKLPKLEYPIQRK